MPPRSSEPLRKTTLNLFERDCEIMARWYGLGWSENVRALVRRHVLERCKRLEEQDGE